MKKEEVKNGVIINGTIYQLVDDFDDDSECNRCALHDCCADPICVALFADDSEHRRFEKKRSNPNIN